MSKFALKSQKEMDATEIYKYFPELTETQKAQIEALGELYTTWNKRINVISRKDIENLYVNHVLHSLVIAKFMGNLVEGTSMLDIGTGGGFPGIPLAIYYPQCKLHLIDRIGKKIKVATAVAEAIGLKNVTFQHGDIGECHAKYDYVVSRAVMPLNDLVGCIKKNVSRQTRQGNRYANGLVCLKGGNIEEEKVGINYPVVEFPVSEFIDVKHFEDKYVVYVKI